MEVPRLSVPLPSPSPGWSSMCEVRSCCMRVMRGSMDTFIGNWNFLLEVFRADGRALNRKQFLPRVIWLFNAVSLCRCAPLIPQGSSSPLREQGPSAWSWGAVCALAGWWFWNFWILELLAVDPPGTLGKHLCGGGESLGPSLSSRAVPAAPNLSLLRGARFLSPRADLGAGEWGSPPDNHSWGGWRPQIQEPWHDVQLNA